MSDGPSCDVAVLGGGPGGYAAALRAAQRGAKVCCIEAGPLGGTCLNVGCIPTKAMLHASGLLWELSAGATGLPRPAGAVDGPAFLARVRSTVEGLRKGLAGLLARRGVQVLAGRGRLAGPGRLAVRTAQGELAVAARAVILATGAAPVRPDWLPWDSPRVWTTDQATTADALPDSIVVLGGGVIGCEFATIYAELGIPTIVVEIMDRLLPGLDADAGRAVNRSLRKRKVQVHTGAKVTSVTAGPDGIAAQLEGGAVLRASHLLAAVGRKPAVEGLGLESLGVGLADGRVKADDRCRTNVAGLYAVGDLAEARQYAHLATRMGLVAADNATGHDARDDRAVVPVGVYTHPEVAAVGLSEDQARAACPALRVGRFPYQASGMAQACGAPEGLAKLLGDPADGRILGAVVVGPHATDVIQEVALAMRHGLTVAQVAETIHAHPTFAEGLAEAAEAWCGLPLHTLG